MLKTIWGKRPYLCYSEAQPDYLKIQKFVVNRFSEKFFVLSIKCIICLPWKKYGMVNKTIKNFI